MLLPILFFYWRAMVSELGKAGALTLEFATSGNGLALTAAGVLVILIAEIRGIRRDIRASGETWVSAVKNLRHRLSDGFVALVIVIAAGLVINLLRAPYFIWHERISRAVLQAQHEQQKIDQTQYQSAMAGQTANCKQQLDSKEAQFKQQLDAQKHAQIDTLQSAFTEEKKHVPKLSPSEASASLRYIQEAIPSVDPQFPYGLKVVVQTDRTLPNPVTVIVSCSGPIGRGDANLVGPGMYSGGSGPGTTNPNIYGLKVQSPEVEPEDTVMFKLYSKIPIRAVGVVAN